MNRLCYIIYMARSNPEHFVYDPNVIMDTIDQVAAHGPKINPKIGEYTSPLSHPDYEAIPGAVPEATAAVGGLFRAFTAEGRQARKEAAARRIEVSGYVGERLLDGEGFYRETVVDESQPAGSYQGDFNNAGKWMLKKSHDKDRMVPNDDRPVTVGEHRTANKLDDLHQQRNIALGKAKQLGRDYGEALTSPDIPKSREEKKELRRATRKIKRYEKQAGAAEDKFDKVADSDTFRGRRLRRRAGL